MRLHHAILAALVVAACGGEPAARPADTARAALPADSAPARDSGRIVVDHQRAVDLTGDGRPERIVVHAEGGPRYDSLQVRMAIVDSAGRELYTHEWISLRYFQYSTPEERSPASDSAEVVRQLARLVADSSLRGIRTVDAVRGTSVEVDTNALRYHLAETALAERRDPSLAAGRPPLTVTEPAQVPTALVTRTAAEVRTQPSYTYFAGGEETYTIRWSPTLRRFVRVFACC